MKSHILKNILYIKNKHFFMIMCCCLGGSYLILADKKIFFMSFNIYHMIKDTFYFQKYCKHV